MRIAREYRGVTDCVYVSVCAGAVTACGPTWNAVSMFALVTALWCAVVQP